jgi:hypothetical protein
MFAPVTITKVKQNGAREPVSFLPPAAVHCRILADVRFSTHYGLMSDIARGSSSAKKRQARRLQLSFCTG